MMQWSGALAVRCLASQVLAQGDLGGIQASCTPATPWAYEGCYGDTENGRALNFPWVLSSSTSSSQYYPGFTGDTNMSVGICLAACRAHGFRYASLYYGEECHCAPIFPLPTPPISNSETPTPGGTSPGTAAASGSCNSVCTGNSAEICGGGAASSLYMDTSFTNDSTAGAYTNYNYLGCFSDINPGPMYVSIETTSTQACASYCGSHGYSYAARSGIDSNTGATTCGCGTEVQAGLQLPESSCFNYCNGSATAV